MCQRIQNRKLHARNPDLRENAPIHELDERVNDALRVNDHLDAIVRNSKEKVSLDHLERLVRQCRAVDRDLSSHAPGRMVKRILERRLSETLGGPLSKRTARRGDDHAADIDALTASNALEN